MPPTSRLKYLFYRYYEKSCTDAEKAELMQLLQRSENDAEVKVLIEQALVESKEKYQLPEENANQILSAILEGSSVPVREMPPSGRWKQWAAAASIAAVIAAGAYTWFASRQKPEGISGRLAEGQHISPGSDRALLTLGDGSVIDLEAAESGWLNAQAGILLNKNKGQLVYETPPGTDETVYNTITTPKGGQYQVVLSDGSHVWLNARSSLRFPTAFTGEERSVRLEGEGYFEITPNKARPFRVRSGEADIEVLGTHFNVKAYANEPAMEATLLEGAVRVSRAGEAKVMQPGQQMQLSAGEMKVVLVDTSSIVAWKNGFFQFNNASLKSIMRQVERWYDVEINYASIPDKRYNGTVLRSSNLSEMLTMLELAGSFRFEVKDRTVKVIN